MRRPVVQVSLQRAMLIVAGLALGLACTAYLRNYLQWVRNGEGHRRAHFRFTMAIRRLHQLAERRDDPECWTDALSVVYTSLNYSAFRQSRGGVAELERVCDEMEQKLREDVGEDTLVWLAGRLRRTGYIRRIYDEVAADYPGAWVWSRGMDSRSMSGSPESSRLTTGRTDPPHE